MLLALVLLIRQVIAIPQRVGQKIHRLITENISVFMQMTQRDLMLQFHEITRH